MKRYCFVLDLKEDPDLIAEYEAYHQAVWPEVLASMRDAGIELMEIYRWQNRLFMIMEVNDTFSFEQKAKRDAANSVVQEWEKLMWQYQQSLPGTAAGEKWQLMDRIF
ncbi:L-rhamnose mutarotase [Pontibacter sp. 172403-2]|uniref:L-rhamnose mutarotase n=1 Tax=Pontibacter rufus TaxID=2791028 RepID=UPI001E4D74A3|nr:L-rhamnose mutarotase [Pontibacter sp. 172403-2]